MAARPIDVVTGMMRAVNARDAKKYASFYSTNASIVLQGFSVLVGREAIEKHELELLAQFPSVVLAFYDLWQRGNRALVHYGVNGSTADGRSMGHEGLLSYRFDASGLIAEEHRYLDSLTPMAQLGMLADESVRAPPVLPAKMNVHMAAGSRAEDENLTLVKACNEALDSKNESAFLATLDEQVVLDELMLPKAFQGKREARECFRSWTRAVPDAKSEITLICAVGAFVLVESIVRGRLSLPLGRYFASEQPFTVHRGAIVQLDKGRIQRIVGFMNGLELAQALGQWPPSGAP
jgi:ketosteroid isomerase-like protein